MYNYITNIIYDNLLYIFVHVYIYPKGFYIYIYPIGGGMYTYNQWEDVYIFIYITNRTCVCTSLLLLFKLKDKL